MSTQAQAERLLVNIVTGTLKAGLGASVLESLKDKVIATALSEATKCAVEGFVGPVLRGVLHLLDETTEQLKKLLSEPLITGVRESNRALAIGDPIDPADQLLLSERLHDAENSLARALSLLPRKEKKGVGEVRFIIWLCAGIRQPARKASFLRELAFG
jgi:hypothetical protein